MFISRTWDKPVAEPRQVVSAVPATNFILGKTAFNADQSEQTVATGQRL